MITGIKKPKFERLINTIKYNALSKKKERVLSMCFVPNNYLFITTDSEIYYVSMSDQELFKKVDPVGSNISDQSEDILNYLTTIPEKVEYKIE